MKNKFVALLMMCTIMLGVVPPAYAETNNGSTDYINSYFYEEEPKEDSGITLYAMEKEKDYKDGLFFKAPKGSADFTFNTDSGDNKLNVYFNNESDVSVTLTLFEKSGFWGSWKEVDSTSISANRDGYFQVTPNSDVTYKVEVSNSTGEKILGLLRVRSFRG